MWGGGRGGEGEGGRGDYTRQIIRNDSGGAEWVH